MRRVGDGASAEVECGHDAVPAHQALVPHPAT